MENDFDTRLWRVAIDSEKIRQEFLLRGWQLRQVEKMAEMAPTTLGRCLRRGQMASETLDRITDLLEKHPVNPRRLALMALPNRKEAEG